MAVAMDRANLGAALDLIRTLVDVGGIDRLGEARPPRPGVVLVRRSEQRLAGNHIDVDAGLLVVQVLASSLWFGRALLRDAILLAGKPVNRVRVFAVGSHYL